MNIKKIIKKANQFIDKLETSKGFKLFEKSEVSPYARCFVIFTKSLTKQFNWLKKNKIKLIYDLNIDLYDFYKKKIINGVDWRYDKSFLQLYCFTLSSLNRHAFAVRKDVGLFKSKVIKNFCANVFPLTQIDDIDDALTTVSIIEVSEKAQFLQPAFIEIHENRNLISVLREIVFPGFRLPLLPG